MGVTITLADYDAMPPGRRRTFKAWSYARSQHEREMRNKNASNVNPDDWSDEAVDDWQSS